METPISSFLQSIDATTLTAIVGQSLRRDTFQLQGWQVTQFAGGFGNPVSLGLYRFEGTGQKVQVVAGVLDAELPTPFAVTRYPVRMAFKEFCSDQLRNRRFHGAEFLG